MPPLLRALLFALLLLGCDGSTPMPSDRDYGAACDLAENPCRMGLSCILQDSFPGGYCSEVCEDGTCGDGAICETNFTPPLCLATCMSADDCRDGYQCWQGTCQPLCTEDASCHLEGARCVDGRCTTCMSDGDCNAGEICTAGQCSPAVADAGLGDTGPNGTPPGTGCTSDEDCASGICLPPALGGVCSIACSNADACFDLTFEAACAAIRFDTDADGIDDRVRTACAQIPMSASQMGAACDSDLTCVASTCQDGQCTEVCDADTQCLTGQICTELTRSDVTDGRYSGCGYQARTGSLSIERIPLGEIELNPGSSRPYTIAIPSDSVSVTIQAERISGAANPLTFYQVDNPAERTLFLLPEMSDLIDQPIRWYPTDEGQTITMLIPNTTPDRVEMRTGVYNFNIGAFEDPAGGDRSNRARVELIVERSDGLTPTQRLDLNIFLVGIGISASSASSNRRMTSVLNLLGDILSPAGISLGTIRFVDVSASDSSRFAVVNGTDGPSSEMAQLFRLSAGQTNDAVNLFLVESIEVEGGGVALGVAGGIPGPVGLHGTENSGVVVGFDRDFIGSAQAVAHVAAHEIGHYIGLIHATERNRPCEPSEDPSMVECSPFGGGDVLTDTVRGDEDNLMFWSIIDGGTNNTVSPGQATVYRLSALTH